MTRTIEVIGFHTIENKIEPTETKMRLIYFRPASSASLKMSWPNFPFSSGFMIEL